MLFALLILLLLILLLLIRIKSQVLDHVRMQPSVLKYDYTSKCCDQDHFDNPNDMMECIQQSSDDSNKRLYSSFNTSMKPMVVIVTYYTLNILESYASKSIATLAAYAEQNDYLFYPFHGPNTKHDHAPYDPRWNKILILLNLLSEEALNSVYVVWVDADLIVLDFGMKIEMIGSLYSQANIIISKDMETATYISNSGFIIVRNSEWSKAFLEQWWSSYDRRKCCDQNVLTWLYDKMSMEEKRNIVILRSDALNTEFPCWKNLKDHNQVLHLAGATSLYRNNIFDSSFKEVCNAIHRDPPFLKHQLTINKEYLETQMLGLLELRVNTTRTIMGKADKLLQDFNDASNGSCSSNTTTKLFKDILSLRNRLNDVLKFDEHEDVYIDDYCQKDLLANEVYIREKMFSLLNELVLHSFPGNNCSMSFLELTRETISMGFELTITKAKTAIDSNREISLRSILIKIQDELLRYFDICSLAQLAHRVLYYKFKNAQLLAESFTRTYLSTIGNNDKDINNDTNNAKSTIYYYKLALDYWKKMVHENYFGADYVLADPYKEGKQILI